MKVNEILQHLDSLPQPFNFDWVGSEHLHDEVFDSEVKTLKQAIDYIKALRERVAEQSIALNILVARYNQLINWVRGIEIEGKI